MVGRLINFLYNEDRAIASLTWDSSQETISSEVGRIAVGKPQVGEPIRNRIALWLCKKLADWLNSNPKLWGFAHTQKAVQHANALDAVDDGQEK